MSSGDVSACRPLAGAFEIIEAFAKHSDQLAVLTNGADELQKKRIAVAGLDTRFARVYTSQGIGFAKPDEKAFEFVQTELGLAPSQWRMVGDDPNTDLMAPKQLGVETWRVERQDGIVRRW